MQACRALEAEAKGKVLCVWLCVCEGLMMGRLDPAYRGRSTLSRHDLLRPNTTSENHPLFLVCPLYAQFSPGSRRVRGRLAKRRKPYLSFCHQQVFLVLRKMLSLRLVVPCGLRVFDEMPTRSLSLPRATCLAK